MTVFDGRICALGEGPFWHPERNQLFWFDILGKRLLSREGDRALEWSFDEYVSAAGWVDRESLLIASESGLCRFDIGSGDREPVATLEADDPLTRSNDGRADPWGGFWIGTMGKSAETGAGAIYRWYRGELEVLYRDITISNSICFAPDRSVAYFTDTPTGKIMRQTLDHEGWPVEPATVFVDLSADGFHPDGAVIDSEGCLWNAQWGASRIARYAPDGAFLDAIALCVSQTSCPAFGGSDLRTLFVTSAAGGREAEPDAGKTFVIDVSVRGQAEHQVIL